MTKRLAITLGDSDGIGPEVVLKYLMQQPLPDNLALTIIGNLNGLSLPQSSKIDAIPMDASKPIGQVSYDAIRTAVELCHHQKVDAIVTGPISKERLKQAGVNYSGHTEMLQDLAEEYYSGQHQSDMLFAYQKFYMLLLTRHIALNEVSKALQPTQITQSLQSLIAFLKQRCQLPAPKIGVLGVNPHAGEINGHEEREILMPILESLGLDRPLAADAAFRGFNPSAPAYDAYVAAYHDQGLIPMKLVAGFQAVNITIGLPFLRTSVSHGTAPDIAGKNIADANGMTAAIETALKLIN